MDFTISISGSIGAGKSTLLDAFEKLGYKVCKEDVSDDKVEKLLQEYYKHPNEKTFLALQEHFFKKRVEMFNTIKDGGIVERCVGEDQVFLFNGVDNGIISRERAMTFMEEFSQRNETFPDVVVFLKCNVDGLMENINTRGRDCEKKITREYLLKLEKLYDNFIRDISLKTKVLVVENLPGDWIKVESLLNCIKRVNQEKGCGVFKK